MTAMPPIRGSTGAARHRRRRHWRDCCSTPKRRRETSTSTTPSSASAVKYKARELVNRLVRSRARARARDLTKRLTSSRALYLTADALLGVVLVDVSRRRFGVEQQSRQCLLRRWRAAPVEPR